MVSNDPGRPQLTSKEPVIDSAKSLLNKESELRGADPNENPSHWRVRFEQVFS